MHDFQISCNLSHLVWRPNIFGFFPRMEMHNKSLYSVPRMNPARCSLLHHRYTEIMTTRFCFLDQISTSSPSTTLTLQNPRICLPMVWSFTDRLTPRANNLFCRIMIWIENIVAKWFLLLFFIGQNIFFLPNWRNCFIGGKLFQLNHTTVLLEFFLINDAPMSNDQTAIQSLLKIA